MVAEKKIEVDFQKAMAQAEKLETLAERMRMLATVKFEDTCEELTVNWRGANALQYLRSGQRLVGEVVSVADGVQRLASDIRKAARRLHNAELAALATAKRRDY